MSALMELFASVLTKFVKRGFEEERVKVAVIGHNVRAFLEDDFVELIRGAEFVLPRWLAEELENRKLVTLQDTGIDEKTISTIAFAESDYVAKRGIGELYELKGYFYSLVRHQIKKIFRKYAESPSLEAVSVISKSLKKMIEDANSIQKNRLRRIINLLNTPSVEPKLVTKMSEEERILFESIYAFLKSYSSGVFKFDESA